MANGYDYNCYHCFDNSKKAAGVKLESKMTEGNLDGGENLNKP